MSTCADFMSYRCVAGCKHFSRDLPENCAVCEFNTGECIDCVSVTECAQRPNFDRIRGNVPKHPFASGFRGGLSHK